MATRPKTWLVSSSTALSAWVRRGSSGATRSGSSASTRSSPRWSCSRTTSSARRPTSCASARAAASLSTTCSTRPSRSAGRPARRTLGMRHYDVQMIGGMVLHDGSIAEMKTGEGKTLMATLPIFLNSLAGDSVHLVTVNDYLARRDAEWMKPIYDALGVTVGVLQNMQSLRGQAGRLRRRRHLRHQLGVRVRLPARQHGLVAGGGRPARPSVRDRRRGRQHPDRRGAHAADHLGGSGGGGRPLPAVRTARADAEGRAEDGHDDEARQRRRRARLRLRVRREAQDGRADRARRREGRALPRHREHVPLRARQPREPPDPVAEGRVAVQARQGLRRDRRRGEDHRRVHRPHPGGQAVVRGPAPGGRGEGARRRARGEPDARHDHPPELLPHVRQARRHDRHRAHRGERVHQDLQARGGGHPHQHADGPGGPQRPDLQDQGRQVGGRAGRDQGPPRSRASRCWSGRSRSSRRRSSRTSCAATAWTTWC